ncbi:MAG: fibronectin type III domain-containing protein, partial [Mesoflavibacter sp.]|nr:fibronectin type III domain-containing protein [Mesoflavibacter sp.]
MKKITFLIFTILLSAFSFGQGQDCSNPIVVGTLPYNTTDDTSNYGNNYNNGDSPCNSYYMSGDDVVYSFTPTTDGVYDITMSNLGGNWSGIHVLDACIGSSPNCVAFEGNSGSADRQLMVNLTAATTYYIIISTWAAPQSTSYTLDINLIACPQPTSLTATNITTTSADLSWTAGGTETLWNVEIVDVTAGGTVTGTVTDSGVENPFLASGLTPDNSYEYYVQADCGGDTSAWVGPFSFSTLPTCPEPSDLTATNIMTTSADLGWTENGSASLYNVEVVETGNTPTGTATDTGVANGFTKSGLLPSVTYDYYVQADCTGGDVSTWVGP